MPTVDVIIPTYKPEQSFFELIERLEQQSIPIQNIIIMNTEEKYWDHFLCYQGKQIKHYENIKVYHHSKREFDHGGTRNRGFAKSNADIVICMTQDAVPKNSHLVENLVKALEKEQIAVAYGRQLATEKSSEEEKVSRIFNYPEHSMIKSKEDIKTLGIKTYFCSNVCAAYQRKIYEKLGGFVKHTIFNEDMIFAAGAIQAGYQIAYVAEAEVFHSHTYTNMEQFRRNFDLGVSQAMHPEIFKEVPSESEGIRLVKETRKRLLEKGLRKQVIPMYLTCGFKLFGYKLGKNYQRLPKKWIKKCSMNKDYWKF